MNFSKIQNIIWDWNGTLLNDVEMCINCMNQLLEPRNLPKLNLNRYREVFTFPVQDYYEEIGIDFNKDPFEIIGHQFMDLYFEGLKTCNLHPDVIEVLNFFQSSGKKQFILSAMEQNALENSLLDFGISSYFSAVYGIDNHLAAGKTSRALQMITENQIDVSHSVLIGDTIHDFQVARELKIKCILIANGHQSQTKLRLQNDNVFSSLECFLSHIVNEMLN